MTNPDGYSIPPVTLGWRLRLSMNHAGYARAQDIADALGYSRTRVSDWLNDKGAPPRTVVLKQWALLCQVPYSWLVTGAVDLRDVDVNALPCIPVSVAA